MLKDDKYYYHYDAEGNLIFKEFITSGSPALFGRKDLEKKLDIKLKGSGVGWLYEWQGNGMLANVILPQGSKVSFNYDPLGRRIAKQYKGRVTRWLWDGNVPLHEWTYEGEFPPKLNIEGNRIEEADEPSENVIIWIFEENSFVPCAKIVGEEQYSIVCDYLGTPTHAYDADGIQVWERELDIYGTVRKGNNEFIPFLYQGQYVDRETGLAYNRFRYYSNESGMYLSQDPIGLAGGTKLYAYALDSNIRLDVFGLFHHTDAGHNVYGLYDIVGYDNNGKPILADKPYYIGITNDTKARTGQHIESGRLIKGKGEMVVLDRNITYGQARGYEQAYIEHYKTKTGIVGDDISATNRGNKINSFDIDNKTREVSRQTSFNTNRKQKLDELNGKAKVHH